MGLGPSGPRGEAMEREQYEKSYFFQFFEIFGFFWFLQKIGFLAYLIAPEVPGPLKSNSASKNTPGDLSTASHREIIIDFRWFLLILMIYYA